MARQRVFLLAAALALCLNACGKQEAATPSPQAGRAVAAKSSGADERSTDERLAAGKKLYSAHCAACHQSGGQGLGGAFPPLAGSDYLANGGPTVAVNAVLHGLTGPITVNGREFNSVMPRLSYLSDSEVADVVTYVFNSWGNPGGEVSAADVAAARRGGD